MTKLRHMTKAGHRTAPIILRRNGPEGLTGVIGQSLTLTDGELLGRALGTFVRQAGGRQIALCFDGRIYSPVLATAITTGLLRTGVIVLRMGRGPVPMLLFGARTLGTDAAVMVTGADEAPDRNGFQFFLGDQALRPNQVQAMLHSIAGRAFISGHGSLNEVDVFESYIHSLATLADPAMETLAISIDTGNGAAGEVATALTRRIPGRYHVLHGMIDGSFPARQPWRRFQDSLETLCNEIRTEACAIGIAFDAAGAQLAILDGRGRFVKPEMVAALFPGLTDPDPWRLAIRMFCCVASSGTSLAALIDRLSEKT